MSKFLTLVAFLIVVPALGAFIGLSFPADEWYQVLNKPFFTPRPQLFGVVWPILYIMVAVAGWRVFVSEGQTPGWGLWVGQMVLNFAWSPTFFGAHQIFWAMLIIAAALALSVTFVSVTWTRDKFASLLFVPYSAWLAFALALNFTIWLMN
ncbi:MAG: TspO/MBR family protein [Pseudomonadota bacterium]